MNLDNFEKNISSKIVDRGYNYFFNGQVDGLEQTDPELWQARVYGTVQYRVKIRTDPENDRKISAWQCDCPYDYGPICKHVVAVLFEMAQQNGNGKEGLLEEKSEKKTRKEKIQAIFDEVNKEDLEQFITSCFQAVDGVENRFLAHFAERIDEDPVQQYRALIRSYGRAAMGRHGFIDYNSASTFTRPLYELNDKADKLHETANNQKALAICQTLIEEVSPFIGSMDDSDGRAGEVIRSAFNTLYDMIEDDSFELKDQLFEWCIEEFPKQKHQGYGFESHFLGLLPSLASSREQEKRFFNLLNRQIKDEKSKPYSSYSVSRLINTKIKYLQIQNRDEEALELLRTHKEIPNFREQLVNRALDAGDFNTAKTLCDKGITIAQEKNHSGTVVRWQEKLFHISKEEGNAAEMRERAEAIFFDGHTNMQWYQTLKETYTEQEWPKKCEKVIERLQKTGTSVYHSNKRILANIFVEENYTEQLLEIIQQDADISFIDHYADHLSEEFPYEVLDLYKQGISEYAKQTGRKHYRNVGRWLHRMAKISGGDEPAYALFKQFFREYHNRPAMKDELGKAFPKWGQAVKKG